MPEKLSQTMMRISDIAGVMRIETGAYSYPWTAGNFLDCLKSGYHCKVMTQEGELVGYSVVMDVLDESHLLNLAVSPSMQGQGIGRMILDSIIDEARSQGRRRMILEVRASNLKAISLYRKAGFYRIHVRRNYYPTPVGREHAIVMGLDL
ncbi:MAG TPA: ribosomal protein S18-alanine N-acetyltransferase [Burkholderiales bacterium]|nr:ribosomal protein S18-alanine N-acetyltransferase [Burkholderiales bacterium]